MATVALRNTFLEVCESQGDATRGRRSRSAPPCGRGNLVAQDAVSLEQIARLNILLAETVCSGPGAAEASDKSYRGVSAAEFSEGRRQTWTPPSSTSAAVDAPASVSSHGASSLAGFRLGADGGQCHDVSEQRAGPRGRPCKGKRDRVKKALAMVEARIQKNPEVFTDGGFFLPPAVERDPWARARVLAHLSQVAAMAGRSTSTCAA